MDFLRNILDYIGFAVCHQIPEKSFVAFSETVSMCARDHGIYLGFFVVFFYYFFLKVLILKKRPVELPSMSACFLLLAIALLMPLDAVLQLLGLYFSNTTRLFSGLAFGFGISPFVLVLFSDSLFKNKLKRAIFSNFELLLLLLFLIALGYSVLFCGDYIIFLTSLIAIVGFLVLAIFINYVVMSLIFEKWISDVKIKFLFSFSILILEVLILRYFHSLATTF